MGPGIDVGIAEVVQGSPAWEAGIRRGDELLSINGQRVRDILDYRYLSAEEQVAVRVRRDGRSLEFSIAKDAGEDLGLEFEEELFDGLHTCANDCIFCFLNQMPSGLRQSLYVRDDDYRLSFAHGNYVTLANMTDEEIARIRSQGMSPIYISVHATEPRLRAEMMGNERAGRIMERLRHLAEAGIRMHTQIVLCPGVNDGPHLERSVFDLSSLHPWVVSVAVVPVGLTRHRGGLAPLKPVGGLLAREVMQACTLWRREFKRRLGTRFVFPSDELYLLSGEPFPSRAAYEGFLQLEDGVGVSRLFLDELQRVRRRAGERASRPGRYVLVTGVLASAMVGELAEALEAIGGVSARVCVVPNRFLGETVTVAGLMAGRDIADSLAGTRPDEMVLVPAVALNGDRFLDDVTLAVLERRIGAAVTAVPPSPTAVRWHVLEAGERTRRAVSCAGGGR